MYGYEPGLCGHGSATFVPMLGHPLTQLNRWKVGQVLLHEEFKPENGLALWLVIWGKRAYGSGAFCCMDILRS